MNLRFTLATLASLSMLVLIPAAAQASCVAPPPMKKAIEEAPAVFVGSVTEVTNGGRWATVKVEDVWKGTSVEESVQVRGGPPDPSGGGGVITSVDREYEPGRTYLFVPFRGKSSVFRDNACTRTTAYAEKLERFNPSPETVDPVQGDRPEGEGAGGPEGDGAAPWPVIGLAGLGAVVGAAVVLLLLRQKRAAPG